MQNNFIKIVETRFSLSDEIKKEINDFIVKSECKDIQIKKLRSPLGLSLHDGIIINEILLDTTLGLFLFILFHELTHQLQYKKYGVDKMYLYLNDVSDTEVSDYILNQEIVADRLSSIKIRQLQNRGLISKDFNPFQIHKKCDKTLFQKKIKRYCELMKDNNIKTFDDVSVFFRDEIIY
jgi:hypothetical protein